MLLTLLPFYLLSNLHCAGMCGPLVMLLAQNQAIPLYFVGRIVGFTCIASLAQRVGLLINSSWLCFLASSFIIMMGITQLLHLHVRQFALVSGFASHYLSKLLVIDRPYATLLFGLATPLLPCGQSLIVFSAAALSGSLLSASLQGCLFALFTTPSLVGVLYFSTLFKKIKGKRPSLLPLATLIVGSTLFLRALANRGLIPHLVIKKSWHLLLY